MIDLLHIISINIEAVVTVLGVAIAVQKKKSFGWLIALTFGIYVIYDIARFLNINIPLDLLYFIFFLASFSILYAVLQIYKKVK